MHKNLNVHNFFEVRNIITISIVDNHAYCSSINGTQSKYDCRN